MRVFVSIYSDSKGSKKLEIICPVSTIVLCGVWYDTNDSTTNYSGRCIASALHNNCTERELHASQEKHLGEKYFGIDNNHTDYKSARAGFVTR